MTHVSHGHTGPPIRLQAGVLEYEPIGVLIPLVGLGHELSSCQQLTPDYRGPQLHTSASSQLLVCGMLGGETDIDLCG